jgi:putative nucleotidyltransferase with HDIG domain
LREVLAVGGVRSDSAESFPRAEPKADLESLMGNCVSVPPMPLVAKKVIELIDDPYSSAGILKKAISSDQALAARVLRMANSAFYSPQETVNDLGKAVMVLGFNTIKEIVVGASLKGVYKSMDLIQKMFWEHSVAVAVGARIISERQHLAAPEGTMVAGLLHDIGKAVMLDSDAERYQAVVEQVYNERVSFSEAERRVFGFNHAEVGVLLVLKWHFSPELGKVVQFHHNDDFSAIQPPEVGRLTAAVSLANLAARKLGVGYRQPDETVDLASSPAAAALRTASLEELDGAACDRLTEEIWAAFEKEKSVFT